MNYSTSEPVKRLHATAKEAANFIVWFATHEHHSEWDKTRYANAIEMVKLDASLSSRFPDDAKWLDWQLKIAFAEMWEAGTGKPYHAEFEDAKSEYLIGTRTPDLLAEMQRVTKELKGST